MEEASYTEEGVVTLIYCLISGCLIAPPTEFISAGLTIQNLLSGYLGSEDLNFVYYHMKRVKATMIFHSIVPFGYYITMMIALPELGLDWPLTLTLPWQLFLTCSLIMPIIIAMLCYYWSNNNWERHPIAIKLGHLASENSTWRSVSSNINVEFRRINKFTSGPLGRRVIVTDSWILKTSTYTLHVAHQSDSHLTLGDTDDHTMSHDSVGGAQFLNIAVESINPLTKSFTIRLNSLEYGDLKEKLQAPVRNARNIVIRQSLSDQFVHAFTDQVNDNPKYRAPANIDLDSCIGCMAVVSNVKLQKTCGTEGDGECTQCYCRPLWCLQCMGKWFASRQNQQGPETWMSGKAPCPMCRATFCVLDVCKIQPTS